MGEHTSRKSKTRNRIQETPTSSSSPSSSSFSGSEDEKKTSRRRHKNSHRRHRERHKSESSSRREEKRNKKKKRERDGKNRKRERSDRHRKHQKRLQTEVKNSESDDSVSGDDDLESERSADQPEAIVAYILKLFPGVAGELEQLLKMIDDGQAVDIKGISERSLMKQLKKLFLALNLKENGDRVFLLRSNAHPTLEVVGSIIHSHMAPKERQIDNSLPPDVMHSVPSDMEHEEGVDNAPAPRRRIIGPEMPSSELLAAAAKLTEAEADLREAKLEGDDELFIGPPPPALVTEAASANEAERFEEVTRIMQAELDSPYDVLGVNRNMSADNIKRRYWKLSLMVHPDKCSHPQAHQAFVTLNKAFKDLLDPEKRKALDEKIRVKEEQEEFKAELKALREAAQWRRSQGISMEGDDELLVDMDIKDTPKRDEWMTVLPPERKPGMTMQSTKFSRSSKEGRGDASVWTDTPSDRAQKAKMNYLEAYNEATALASNEENKKRTNTDAKLVDEYNKAKRSKSLVQKHQEEKLQRSKQKSKQPIEKEEWVGQHPWKPWDREKDLTAGRQSVKLDSENMAMGLSSRFSSGSVQRNFL